MSYGGVIGSWRARWPRRRRCPICGMPNHACGGPTNIPGVDQRMELTAMARGQDLQTVDYVTAGGYKTKVRVSPDKQKRFEQSSKRNEEQLEKREQKPERQEAAQQQPPSKERRAAGSGDVRNK